MAQRLPTPGGDNGTWGAILNGFLEVSHNADGTLSNTALTNAGAVTTSQLGAASGVATLNGSSQLTGSQIPSSVVTTSTTLGGDLSGTLASAVVAKLNGNALGSAGAIGNLFDALGWGIITDPQWAGGADPTGTNACDAALAAITAACGTIIVPAGTYKITTFWQWNWWTNVIGVGTNGGASGSSKFVWAGTAGGQVMRTQSLSSVSNPNTVRWAGRAENFYITYPYSLLASGSCGLYIALPSGSLQKVMVGTDHQSDYTVAACSTSGTSQTVTSTNNFATTGVTTGMAVYAQASSGTSPVSTGTTVTGVSGTSITLSTSVTLTSATLFFGQPTITGSKGIWVDGCQNPDPINITGCSVIGQFQDCFTIATDLAHLRGCDSGYGANGWTVEQDSTNSGSGPPYQVTIQGFHGYHQTNSWGRVVQLNHIYVDGGFNENVLNSVPAYRVETTGTGGTIWAVGPHSNTALSTSSTTAIPSILSYATSTYITFNDFQNQWTQTWTGNSSTGIPSGYNHTAFRVVDSSGVGTSYSTASTTAVVAIWNGASQHNGPTGGLRWRFRCQINNSIAGDGYEITITQTSASPTQGAAPPSGTTLETYTHTVEYASNNDAVYLEGSLGGQNVTSFFVVSLNATTGGTVSMTHGLMTVEAS